MTPWIQLPAGYDRQRGAGLVLGEIQEEAFGVDSELIRRRFGFDPEWIQGGFGMASGSS